VRVVVVSANHFTLDLHRNLLGWHLLVDDGEKKVSLTIGKLPTSNTEKIFTIDFSYSAGVSFVFPSSPQIDFPRASKFWYDPLLGWVGLALGLVCLDTRVEDGPKGTIFTPYTIV